MALRVDEANKTRKPAIRGRRPDGSASNEHISKREHITGLDTEDTLEYNFNKKYVFIFVEIQLGVKYMARSFGDALRDSKGIGLGFDFTRIFLALCVLAWHVPEILYGKDGGAKLSGVFGDFIWISHYAIVPMFFGLSGFLVAGSAQRLSLRNFALNRGLRIFPALIVEILLSALVIGPIFTEIPISQYFSDKNFYAYLFNIIGLVHYPQASPHSKQLQKSLPQPWNAA